MKINPHHSALSRLRCQDSNLGMADSKSAALQLGDTAITSGNTNTMKPQKQTFYRSFIAKIKITLGTILR